MKNKILFFCLGAIVVLAIFWIKREMHLISYSDPDFNTIYSSGYKDGRFNDDLLGKNETELDNLLGKPLSIYQTPFFNALLYTTKKDLIFLNKDFGCIQFKSKSSDRQFMCFYFDSIGKVKKAKIVGYDESESDFINLSKPDILRKFGSPDDEVYISPYETLSYSELTKGVQSGKKGTINIRQVFINKNKVAIQIVRKISGETRYCKSCECK